MKTTLRDPERLNHQKWCLIADKIEREPGLLKVPLENLKRWSKSRRDGIEMLDRWKELIEAAQTDAAGFDRLLSLLRNDGEESGQMKSYSPFPGILTSEEVDRFTCGWRH